ncbi:MAG: 50S ribosomal protein L24 [Candidatus Peribacteraceae bacterium]|nr:50S ribosomal protein L24 [Candidatus Peribacteraceae bacterium]
MKLRTGDHVVVISGKDKGKTGNILRVLGDRVVVSDINMRTKHIRKRADQAGQIMRYEASISVSNVMLVDPKTKKRTRVGYRLDEKGRKQRFMKQSGQAIVEGKTRAVKKAPQTVRRKKKGDEEVGQELETPQMVAQQVQKPSKTPFWKKMGFGAEALDEAEMKDTPRSKQDHSVPAQSRVTESFQHQRGD